MKKGIPFTFIFIVCTACGRSEYFDLPPKDAAPDPSEEICDGLDNDLNGIIDDPFIDTEGRYITVDHCGQCNTPCSKDNTTLSVDCALVSESPVCVATDCIDGYIVDMSGHCVEKDSWLCKTCFEDEECGNFAEAVCSDIGDELRCTYTCEFGQCPMGYVCDGLGICEPSSGSCSCRPGDFFDMYCEIPVGENICYGTAHCEDGILSDCTGSDEICDGQDNDCNGVVDDPYINSFGQYGVDIFNCGACGVDCSNNPLPISDLTCGGPPTDPFCAMLCTDALDGVGVGDHLDADLEIATGCECIVQSLTDDPGPISAAPQLVDTNCDGADGIVINSYYVSPDGNDSDPGSHLNPMATIQAAVAAAYASLSTANPRPHVFISAGTYIEVLEIKEGVKIHGGYAPDFLTLDPDTFVTEVVAPSWNNTTGGAALTCSNVGSATSTEVEGLHFKGASAIATASPSIGARLSNCGGFLSIDNCVFKSGDGVDGSDGGNGTNGAFATGTGGDGDLQRAAVEDASHNCVVGTSNIVTGGNGQYLLCGSVNVGGGDGGDSSCPGDTNTNQPSGVDGHGTTSTPGGNGGDGGWNCRGPMFSTEGCPVSVCCGLANFIVSSSYELAADGEPGLSGQDGLPGAGCTLPMGSLASSSWTAGISSAGTNGSPGSGGGGGGAGGGALMQWTSGSCEYADGLGGGGGGGGAGGCGGGGGQPGTSGGPSISMVIATGAGPAAPSSLPSISSCVFQTGPGGNGGNGGTGGNGGIGGSGGLGGDLPSTSMITPTLAGPSSGGHGGHGGSGGGGGGGGGGCGGSVVGIWMDVSPSTYPGQAALYQIQNTFELGAGGAAGNGGGGSIVGQQGFSGEVHNVYEM